MVDLSRGGGTRGLKQLKDKEDLGRKKCEMREASTATTEGRDNRTVTKGMAAILQSQNLGSQVVKGSVMTDATMPERM